MNLTLRWPSRVSEGLWCAWLLIAVAITAGPFLWHVEYFKSPGPEFYRLFLAALPLLGVVLWLYPIARRKRIWRYEPALLGGFLLAALLSYEPRATLVVLWMVAACYTTGRWMLRRFGLDAPGHAAGLALASSLGFAVLMLALFWMGLLGWFYWWSFAALLGVPCVVFRDGLPELLKAVTGIFRNWKSEEEFRHPLGGILTVFAALLLVCTMAVALAPSLTFDVLRMHLPSARYYADLHTLRPLPMLDYSYFPQGGEVLMTLAYVLGGQAAAQLLSPLFFALSLLLLYAVARLCAIRPLGAVAGCVFGVAFPFLHWTGSVAKNDMILALLQLSALYGYLRWRETRNFNWIRAGMFLVATSFGVKHVALFGAIPLGILFLCAAWREQRRWRALASLALVFLLFGLHWQARTYLLTGNPVYPMNLERSAKPVAVSRNVERSSRLLFYVALPYSIHFRGIYFFESPSANPAGVFLILFTPLWLLVRRTGKAPAERACLLLLAIYVTYWARQGSVLRYAIVPALLLAVFTAARLPAFWQGARGWVRGTVGAAAAYSLLFALSVAMIVEINGPQLRYFARRIDKQQYLREALRTYGSLEFLRTQWRPGDRVFGVSNCSFAYAPDPAAMDCFLTRRKASVAADSARILAKLNSAPFRFLILPDEPLGAAVLAGLKQDAAPLYGDSYFTVFRLGGARGAE